MSAVPSEAVLQVDQVFKSFNRRVVGGGYTTFKTQLVQRLRPGLYKEQIRRQKLDVLKGISFEVARGETLGIIGRNGAGKSTLLKLLTGIYKPTSGRVARLGRISALLELGAGFHPEFSGRENIYMNGMILGLSKRELREREAQIIRFAELEDFIDAPVRTYSSGMYMRLAFAIAVNVDPDILIIDEILAVGDEHFQHKSRAKLDEFKSKAIAIVLVTHSLETVQAWCSRALWLDEGKVAAYGEPAYVVQQYRARVAERENQQRLKASPELPPAAAKTSEPKANPNRWGDGKAVITKVTVKDKHGQPCMMFPSNDAISIEVDYEAKEALPGAIFGIGLWTGDGQCLFGANTLKDGIALPKLAAGAGRFVCALTAVPLVGRNLRLEVAIADPEGNAHDHWRDIAHLDFISAQERYGCVVMDSTWSLGTTRLSPARHEAPKNLAAR